MKLRMLLAAAAVTTLGSMASAATVTQLIHFDEVPNNGLPNYTTADGNFHFDPVNLNSGNCADSTLGGTGSCLIEERNGYLTDMTRLTGDNTFSLDGFYFHLTGNGQASGNFITATTSLGSATFMLGQVYANVIDYTTGLAAGALVHNGQYVADVSGLAVFQDITGVSFTALSSGQTRLDCVVASFDGTTTSPLQPGTSCGLGDGGGGGIIPVPATLPLLLGALGVGGFVARRKQRKS